MPSRTPSSTPDRWRQTRRLAVIALAAVPAVGAPAAHAAPTPAAAPKMTPKLATLAKSKPAARSSVIVRFDEDVRPATARRLVRRAGGRPGRPLPLVSGLEARLGAAAAARLARSTKVQAVSINAPIKPAGWNGIEPSRLLTTFNESIRSKDVWGNNDGTTGRGVGVAVIDTGIAGDHVDFRRSRTDGRSRVVASAVVNPDATTALDAVGHGTHVAGLIAGNGGSRTGADPLYSRYAGAAPEADLIAVKVADEQGNTTVGDVIAGLQFVVDHKTTYNIRVVNLSLNSTVAESYKTDPLDAAVEEAWFKGITVVTAAGNRGTDADAVGYAPANDPYVITVGAVDERGTKNVDDDVLPTWSSRGTTQDGYAKPEVLAPGAKLVAPLAPASLYGVECPTCVVSGQYLRIGGTSMAAGVVSGAAAVLLQQNPNWTPNQVKGALISKRQQASRAVGHEIDVNASIGASGADLRSNAGLTPNTLIDPTTGSIDYTRTRWSRTRWSDAAESLRTRWSAANYACATCTGDATAVDPTRTRWSTVGYAGATKR